MPKTTFKNGIEVPAFDHSAEDLSAYGYTEEAAKALFEKANKIVAEVKASGTPKHSAIIERFYNELTKMEICMLYENERLGNIKYKQMERMLADILR